MWDWNGTLLADTALTVRAANAALASVGAFASVSVPRWREVSDRPIRRTYVRLVGRDLTPPEWTDIGRVWLSAYLAGLDGVSLAPDAREALRLVREAGVAQSIVSMHLQEEVRAHAAALDVVGCFDRIVGIPSECTPGAPFDKATLIADLSAQLGVPTSDMVMIGDMLDDAEAAQRTGAQAVLVGTGDTAPHRLANSGFPVCDSLVDAVRCVLRQGSDDDAAAAVGA